MHPSGKNHSLQSYSEAHPQGFYFNTMLYTNWGSKMHTNCFVTGDLGKMNVVYTYD